MIRDSKRTSTISELARLQIWIDISEAINYIHDRSIVHSDIKPQNIILRSADNRAILCDFGNAFIVHSSQPLRNGGTPSYIAPEFLQFERSYPSDIWAFGVTMAYVFKRFPLPTGSWCIADIHSSDELWHTMSTWIGKIIKMRDRLPKHLRHLRTMLILNPRKRITSSQLMNNLKTDVKNIIRGKNIGRVCG